MAKIHLEFDKEEKRKIIAYSFGKEKEELGANNEVYMFVYTVVAASLSDNYSRGTVQLRRGPQAPAMTILQ